MPPHLIKNPMDACEHLWQLARGSGLGARVRGGRGPTSAPGSCFSICLPDQAAHQQRLCHQGYPPWACRTESTSFRVPGPPLPGVPLFPSPQSLPPSTDLNVFPSLPLEPHGGGREGMVEEPWVIKWGWGDEIKEVAERPAPLPL